MGRFLRKPIEVNQRFGRWLVLHFDSKKGQDRLWECLCDCGTKAALAAGTLLSGESHSCGCSRRDPKKAIRYAWKRRIARVRMDAADRGFAIDLADEQILRFCEGSCHYCGDPPKKNFNFYRRRLREAEDRKTPVDAEFFKYYIIFTNGIDRIDSAQGYILANCVSCCEPCNKMKSKLPVVEFLQQCEKVTAHQKRAAG